MHEFTTILPNAGDQHPRDLGAGMPPQGAGVHPGPAECSSSSIQVSADQLQSMTDRFILGC